MCFRILQKERRNEKQWLCLGNMFIKMEKKSASRLLEKGTSKTAVFCRGSRNEVDKEGRKFSVSLAGTPLSLGFKIVCL